MAVTAKWYGVPIQNLVNGTRLWDWDTDTIKCMLCNSSYAPNQDTHQTRADVSNEVSGAGYTAGGTALTTKVVSYDTASNEVRLDADDATWAAATFTARYGVVYKDTGTPATSPLIGYIDFGADQSVSGATFTIQWDPTGVLKITAS